MRTIEVIVILLLSSFSGWLISWLIIKFIFWPVKKLSIGGLVLQGILPAGQHRFSSRAGHLIQAEFMGFGGLEEKVADPALIEKLKPEIEAHVDHFLKEKLKTVFPILSQFMGEKTLSQFKTAFLLEIDNLLPVIMKKYISGLKNEIRLDELIADKLSAIPVKDIRDGFYANAGKEIRYFNVACTLVGLIMGALMVGVLWMTR